MQIVTHIVILSFLVALVPGVTTSTQSTLRAKQIEFLVPIEMTVANIIKSRTSVVFGGLNATVTQLYGSDEARVVLRQLGACYEDFADRFYRGIDVAEFDIYQFNIRCSSPDPAVALQRILDDVLWIINYLSLGCRNYLDVDLYTDLNVAIAQMNNQTMVREDIPFDAADDVEQLILGLVGRAPTNIRDIFSRTLGPILAYFGFSDADQDEALDGLEDIFNSQEDILVNELANPYDADQVAADSDDDADFDQTIDGVGEVMGALREFLSDAQRRLCGVVNEAFAELQLETERLAE